MNEIIETPITATAFIKQMTSKAILRLAPDYKQRNMTARAVEIADAKASGTATPEDLVDADAIAAVWATIKALRAKSNELEAQYNNKELTIAEQRAISIAIKAVV